MTEARYLKPRDAADYLSVSRNTLDALVKRGKLPYPVKLSARLVRFDRIELDKYLGLGVAASDADQWDEALNASAPPARARRQAQAGRR